MITGWLQGDFRVVLPTSASHNQDHTLTRLGGFPAHNPCILHPKKLLLVRKKSEWFWISGAKVHFFFDICKLFGVFSALFGVFFLLFGVFYVCFVCIVCRFFVCFVFVGAIIKLNILITGRKRKIRKIRKIRSIRLICERKRKRISRHIGGTFFWDQRKVKGSFSCL